MSLVEIFQQDHTFCVKMTANGSPSVISAEEQMEPCPPDHGVFHTGRLGIYSCESKSVICPMKHEPRPLQMCLCNYFKAVKSPK